MSYSYHQISRLLEIVANNIDFGKMDSENFMRTMGQDTAETLRNLAKLIDYKTQEEAIK